MVKAIAGQSIEEWKKRFPLLEDVVKAKEVCWDNPSIKPFKSVRSTLKMGVQEISEAEQRLNRFSPYLTSAFPEMIKTKGIIESPLIEISKMKERLKQTYSHNIDGKLLLKCDNLLPIAGSIKARGGIYEVLKHAETLAVENGLLTYESDYAILSDEKYQKFFSQYAISVGSTGNLGLSIGMIGAKLGFRVTVHMSSDAKSWKKELLRAKGVEVIEYDSDYSAAVEEGRKRCESDKGCYFIDDEHSSDLFLGYAVAAQRLQKQLEEMNIVVDKEHPLVVYLPCGVGGGPGGVTYGLKSVFGDNVHCYFAEPTHSPCMLIGMMTKLHDSVSVQDFGLSNKTIADGLAVGRPSSFVGKMMEHVLTGIYTVSDEELYKLLTLLSEEEDIYLEPSALAGMYGPLKVEKGRLKGATHIVWATGGKLVPHNEMEKYVRKGQELLHKN